ncbi:replicase, partial [Legionella pneumophila]
CICSKPIISKRANAFMLFARPLINSAHTSQ